MKRIWTKSLALSLGLLAGSGTRAEETVWSSQPAPSIAITAPAASLGKPVVIASTSTETKAGVAPPPGVDAHGSPAAGSPGVVASIGRPVPIASSPHADPQVQPVGFSVPDPTAPVVRGQSPEVIAAKPMPTGSASEGETPAPNGAPAPGSPPATTLHGWRRADDVVASTRPQSGSAIVPAAIPPGGSMMPPHGAPGTLFATSPDLCGSCGADCGSGCCPGCNPLGCCPSNRWYVSAEYLYWSLKGDRTPPLVTTGTQTLPVQNVLFGGRDLGTQGQSGGRIAGGWWFTDNHLWGIEADFFIVGSENRFHASSLGNPALGRPIIDQSPLAFARDPATGLILLPNPTPNPRFGLPNAEFVAFLPPSAIQGGVAGSVDIQRRSNFWGADANLRRNLLCGPNGYLDLFFGYRMLGLDESLSITESLVAVGNTLGVLPGGGAVVLVPNGTTLQVNDRFAVSNRFYGGQVGFNGETRFGCWSLGGKMGVALGNTQQVVDITGGTVTVTPGGGVSGGPGGLLALQGTNLGHYTRNHFSVVPEFGLTLGYQFTPCLRGFVGYNFIYWSNVVRPGEQIDVNVNRSFQPGSAIPRAGAAVPAFGFNSTDFYAQGVSLGLEFRY